MSWPTPRPGLVLRYSYLWRRERDTGREEGSKDRPCAVVLTVSESAGGTRVLVLPITHAPPEPPDEGIELPQSTKKRLGLDSQRSWVIVSETNQFVWPGPDLRFLPNRGPETSVYGFMPPATFATVRNRFFARAKEGKVSLVSRTQ